MTHLSVGERKVDPSIIQDLPVAALDVIHAADQVCVDRCLDGDLALRPSSLDQLASPENWGPGRLMRCLRIRLKKSETFK